MKRGLKLIFALMLVVVIFAFVACDNPANADFDKVFDDANFENVTITMSLTETEVLSSLLALVGEDAPEIDFAAATATISLTKDSMLLSASAGEYAVDVYIAIDKDGNYDIYPRIKEGTEYEYAEKVSITADMLEELAGETDNIGEAYAAQVLELLNLDLMKKDNFEYKDGYWIIKDSAKKEIQDLLDLAAEAAEIEISFSVKMKIEKNKLTELTVEVSAGTSALAPAGLVNDITVGVKFAFSNYGTTKADKPSWVNATNFPAPEAA